MMATFSYSFLLCRATVTSSWMPCPRDGNFPRTPDLERKSALFPRHCARVTRYTTQSVLIMCFPMAFLMFIIGRYRSRPRNQILFGLFSFISLAAGVSRDTPGKHHTMAKQTRGKCKIAFKYI